MGKQTPITKERMLEGPRKNLFISGSRRQSARNSLSPFISVNVSWEKVKRLLQVRNCFSEELLDDVQDLCWFAMIGKVCNALVQACGLRSSQRVPRMPRKCGGMLGILRRTHGEIP